MYRDELVEKVEELGPWHYCHIIDHSEGVVSTGSSMVPAPYEKLTLLLAAGAFPEAEYPKVLDLGSNSGLVSMWFVDNKKSHVVAAECGSKYYPQLEFIVKIKNYANVIPWDYDITKGNYGKNEFDLVLFLGTMHHIAAAKHSVVFKASFEALKPGGTIVVQTKGELPVMKRLEAAGFTQCERLPYSQQDRLAWIAKKPN